MIFKNDFGKFDLKEVIVNKSDVAHKFNEIAYMKVKCEKFFFFQKRYLQIVFIHAYSKKYNLDKSEVGEAKKFVTSFTKVRAHNTSIP